MSFSARSQPNRASCTAPSHRRYPVLIVRQLNDLPGYPGCCSRILKRLTGGGFRRGFAPALRLTSAPFWSFTFLAACPLLGSRFLLGGLFPLLLGGTPIIYLKAAAMGLDGFLLC